jgi:hypothetical protein
MNFARNAAFALAATVALVYGCSNKPITPTPRTPIPASAVRACGDHDSVHKYDLHDDDGDEAMVPCGHEGGHTDYSGAVKIETTADGVRIRIEATDDDVKTGALGGDIHDHDAVMVYPKGKGSKAVEIVLHKTANGYKGERVIKWDELGKLNDEGTKIEVAIFDHDQKTGQTSEEMHVAVSVSTGKSCEKARDENPDSVEIGKAGKRDLTVDELGAPMKTDAFIKHCALADDADADICVALKAGKVLGVSVGVTPFNNKVAACIDKATRKLKFPASDRIDIVRQKF